MLNDNLFYTISEKLRDNELSINALHKSLKQDGSSIHKLVLTGYLKALEELGYVDERSVPPSKIFRLKPKKSDNLYELIGKHAKRLATNEGEEAELAADCLSAVLKRPVFREELRRCGVSTMRIKREEKKDEELIALLNRNGYSIPEGDVCYAADERPEIAELLGAMIAEVMNVKLVSTKTKQKKLDEV
jgi:DNA-binding HxlR family transcriptional regulator